MKNALTGAGHASFDSRESITIKEPKCWEAEELDWFYLGNDIARRIVDRPADEMVRRWFTLSQDVDSDTATKVLQALDDLEAQTAAAEALAWAAKTGGSVIVFGANDGAVNLAEPLDYGALKSLEWLEVLDRYEIEVAEKYPNSDKPKVYRITGTSEKKDPRLGDPSRTKKVPIGGLATGTLMHESRVHRMLGVRTPRRRRIALNGWCESVYTALWPVLRDYTGSWDAGAQLMKDFVVTVFRIEGLAEAIARGDEEIIRARLQNAKLSMSMLRAIILNANEEFERKTADVTGLTEFCKEFAFRLAAAADMPVTVLMGMAPAGLNATGDNDVRGWYDRLSSRQETTLRPFLNKLLRILFATKEGPTGGKEPPKWEILFRPLWQLTEKEQAELEKITAEKDAILVNNQIVSAQEIRQSRFAGGRWKSETVIDPNAEPPTAEPEPEEDDDVDDDQI